MDLLSVREVQGLQPLRHAGEHQERGRRRLGKVLPDTWYSYDNIEMKSLIYTVWFMYNGWLWMFILSSFCSSSVHWKQIAVLRQQTQWCHNGIYSQGVICWNMPILRAALFGGCCGGGGGGVTDITKYMCMWECNFPAGIQNLNSAEVLQRCCISCVS